MLLDARRILQPRRGEGYPEGPELGAAPAKYETAIGREVAMAKEQPLDAPILPSPTCSPRVQRGTELSTNIWEHLFLSQRSKLWKPQHLRQVPLQENQSQASGILGLFMEQL